LFPPPESPTMGGLCRFFHLHGGRLSLNWRLTDWPAGLPLPKRAPPADPYPVIPTRRCRDFMGLLSQGSTEARYSHVSSNLEPSIRGVAHKPFPSTWGVELGSILDLLFQPITSANLAMAPQLSLCLKRLRHSRAMPLEMRWFRQEDTRTRL
jgi:hypothetical protein